MTDEPLNVLLVSNDAADARRIRRALGVPPGNGFRLERARRLSATLERLQAQVTDVILLDMSLPDSTGMATFDSVHASDPSVPILILAAPAGEALAMEATDRGALEYLLTDRLDAYWLPRILRSVIASKRGEETLFVERERAQVTLNSIGDAVLSTDVAGNVTYLNVVAEHMTGWSCREAVGRPVTDVFTILDATTREAAANPIARALRENRTVGLTADCILVRRDGVEAAIEDSAAPIHDRGGRLVGAVIVFHDVSAARDVVRKMAHLAQHDFLTDLPNRVLFSDRVTNAIALARRHGNGLAVMFLDLDGFKHINDSLGHPCGDRLLQSVARRLLACVRTSDTVSRQGGDEFVLLLPELEHGEDPSRSARKVLLALSAPHRIGDTDLHITGSIGVSVYPDDGQDADTLIRCADTAMYHAKDAGRNNVHFFTEDMNRRAMERHSLEGSLRTALAADEFRLDFQPQLNLASGAITGVEALLRWRPRGRGPIQPEAFLPVAEECGLIRPIGQWVLREACTRARAWIDAGLSPLPVAVNVSATELRNPAFLDDVRATLAQTRLAPGLLELELTESVLMLDTGFSATRLAALKDMGVRLAVDDFGTGYSSLSYLRRFPIDTLKIDQSFLTDITSRTNDRTILSAVISMGNILGKRVVAEGIETTGQLAFLQRQHCGEGQGFHFGAPLDADAFAALLGSGRHSPGQWPAAQGRRQPETSPRVGSVPLAG